ncbi:MAG: hypothetical protein KatS3mg068_2271 [Candidatus Sericytochromatia bacterium]|nr:MAG: hypothetical protein KatS3mg068_2271 [Candidatus Sericytochromatia bacterium]
MVKFIEKRNKKIEDFSREKLSKSLEKAIYQINVNKEILVDYIEDLDLNIVKSSDLNKLLIKKAVSLTNIDDFENLKWRFVASRIVLETYIKLACINRNNPKSSRYVNDYYEFLQMAVENNVYDKTILEEYSKKEIENFRKELKEEYDFGFDYAGMNILTNRYLVKLNGKEFEKPQEMFLSISLLLALPEKKENRIQIAKEFYHAIASRKISLATPILLNLRKPNGNLASCFIGAMDDDLDSIYYTLDQLAQISKNAGGCGVNISRIRCAGSYIKNVKGASSGVMPWVKLINDTGIAVNQQGARAGAITVALDIWHYDIEEFLHCQTENGDHRKKAFDIFPQIVIPDLFMKRVEENKDWTLLDPYEVRKKYNIELAELYGKEFEEKYTFLELEELEFKKVVKAKELFKMFFKNCCRNRNALCLF